MKTLSRLLMRWIWLIQAVTTPAWAHDPFASSTRLIAFADRMEIAVTMGADAAREFLKATQLPPREVSRLTRASAPYEPIDITRELAPRLFAATAGTDRLDATRFTVQPLVEDIIFVATYPLPAQRPLFLRASYFDGIEFMQNAEFVAIDFNRKVLQTIKLSPRSAAWELPLPAPPPTP